MLNARLTPAQFDALTNADHISCSKAHQWLALCADPHRSARLDPPNSQLLRYRRKPSRAVTIAP